MVAFCAVVQVICAFVTLCLTVYVVLRDTRHMNEQDERQELAEKLAQPSSIAAWLERDSTGESRIAIRNDSDLPVYEVVATIVVTHGAGCCKHVTLLTRGCSALICYGFLGIQLWL